MTALAGYHEIAELRQLVYNNTLGIRIVNYFNYVVSETSVPFMSTSLKLLEYTFS